MAFEDWFVERARLSGKMHRKASLDDKLAFFQQLHTLIVSGAPLMQSLHICAQQSPSIQLREMLKTMAERVSSGSSLHEAAMHHTNILEHFWIEIMKTGEMTGRLGEVLEQLVQRIGEARDTRRQVGGALVYPVVLSIIATGAMAIMLWFVVPTFAGMFEDMGAELPGITQAVVDASQFLVDYGLYLLGGLIAFIFLIRKILQTDAGRRVFCGVGLAIPLVGELMVNSAMYRFSSTTALLLDSGVPLLEALGILRGAFHKNPIYRDAIEITQHYVAAGRSLADSLDETVLFTGMMINMIRIGEESARLGGVMNDVAPYYKGKMESMTQKVAKLLEPAIIVGMGAAMGGIMMSIYMPMFEMAGKVN